MLPVFLFIMTSIETKLISLQSLKKKLITLRRQGKTIAFTNGCFDLMHIGHVKYLEAAGKAVQSMIGWWKTPKDHYINGNIVGKFDSTQGTGYWFMTPRAINTPSPPKGKT